MPRLEPIIRDIIFKEKIILIDELILKVNKITGVEKEKIYFRIDKLMEKNYLYRLQENGIALQNFGEKLEDEIHSLLLKVVYKEYLFKNPLLDNGKELCDLLIYFDNCLVLIQAKTAKFEGNYEKFIRKTVTSSMHQLNTSINRVQKEDFSIDLQNIKGETVRIEKDKIGKIFGLIVIYHIEEDVSFDKAQLTTKEVLDKMKIIPHILSSDELGLILTYFNTLADFIDYLEKREFVVSNKSYKFISEEDLIGLYYRTGRTMIPNKITIEELREMDFISYVGFDEDFLKGELKGFLDKKMKADEPSFFIDDLINRVPDCDDPQYIEVIRRFHRLNRFQRRCLGLSAFEKYERLMKSNKDFGYRFIMDPCNSDVGYVFVFSNLPEENTKILLQNACSSVKYKYNIKEIIGVAQHPYAQGICKHHFLIDSREYDKQNKELEELYSKMWDVKSLKHMHFEEF